MNLNLTCPINSTGYGVAGYNVWQSLVNLGANVACFSIGSLQLPPHVDAKKMFDEMEENRMQTDRVDWPSLLIMHSYSLSHHVGKKCHIGYSFFELNKFGKESIIDMNCQDHMFVTSEWGKNVILDQTRHTDETVHVVPLGVDRDIFNEDVDAFGEEDGFQNDKFRVFMGGKYEVRKGHDAVAEIFAAAFPHEPDVELVIFSSNPFLRNEKLTEWNNLFLHNIWNSDQRVKFVGRFDHFQDVARLIKTCSVGLFPARAEGWNLELLEFMACGKPVIATNYSAHTTFCTNENAHLLEPEGLEVASDDVFFTMNPQKGEWLSITPSMIKQAADYLRHEYEIWKQSGVQVNKAGIETSKHFSWNNTGSTILDILNNKL